MLYTTCFVSEMPVMLALTGWLIQVHVHACTAVLRTTEALSQAGTRKLNATTQVWIVALLAKLVSCATVHIEYSIALADIG